MVRDRRRLLEHRGSAICEQLGGFYRAKEEFNGVGAVVSYLNNKGDHHETYNNRTSNCIRSPKLIRACTRRNAHWEFHSSVRKPRRYRSHCEPAQEYFREYVCSHRARSKRLNANRGSYESDRRIKKWPAPGRVRDT